MNIRSIYLFLIVVLSLGLFFEWSSEKKDEAIKNHLLEAQSPAYEVKDGFVVIENEKLYVVVETQTGYIVETRIKEHLVENIDGSLGYRVFGSSEDGVFNYYFKSGFEGNPTHHMRLLTLVLVLLNFEIILGVFLKEYPF